MTLDLTGRHKLVGKGTVRIVDREKVRIEFGKTYPADTPKAKGEAFRRSEKAAVDSALMMAREVGGITHFWPTT